jgi:hypothetical protein
MTRDEIIEMAIQALLISEPYVVEALARHDEAYDRHPSTEPERQLIVSDLETTRAAIARATSVKLRGDA